MYLANIYVTLKPTVNDPQGLTIKGALHNLGFTSVDSVRAGKYLQVRLDESDKKAAEQKVKEMCQQLLSNPVIENYRFDIQSVQ